MSARWFKANIKHFSICASSSAQTSQTRITGWCGFLWFDCWVIVTSVHFIIFTKSDSLNSSNLCVFFCCSFSVVFLKVSIFVFLFRRWCSISRWEVSDHLRLIHLWCLPQNPRGRRGHRCTGTSYYTLLFYTTFTVQPFISLSSYP